MRYSLSILRTALLLVVLAAASKGIQAQIYSVATNLAGIATTNANVELSAAINRRWSIHLGISYNPFTFDQNKKMKHLSASPAVRYWMVESYGRGYFVGVHALAYRYNIGGLLSGKYRYDGTAYGGGLSAGLSIPVKVRWNIEFELGVGVVSYTHDKYQCPTCGDKIGERSGLFLVPSRTAINLVYLF